MQASGARGSIGKASYEAVRKHIQAGKKATEAFRLVAQETGRSTATVQTAYYRVARSLPGGGGVQLRPRKKTAARRAAAKSATASKPAARRGRPPKSATAAPAASAASAARQLSDATAALVAHVARLESELAEARKDSQRLAQIERALGR
jgi:chemotaxis protein histidine kinase CheA